MKTRFWHEPNLRFKPSSTNAISCILVQDIVAKKLKCSGLIDGEIRLCLVAYRPDKQQPAYYSVHPDEWQKQIAG